MHNNGIKTITATVAALLLAVCSGCATVEGPKNPDDPFESFNRSMYQFNDTVDIYIMKPVAKGYQAVTPDVVDTGVTNFFSNLDDIIVVANDLLQLKFHQAVSDTTRIVFNTVFGVLGIFDVATEFGLPKHNEDFGQTLGYWGVGTGPYLVLPFLGPSNIRDGSGLVVDSTQFDVTFNSDGLDDNERNSALTLKYVDIRADLLSASKIVDESAPDPYAFLRDAYMQRRLNKVHDGNPPSTYSDEELFEDDFEMEPSKK